MFYQKKNLEYIGSRDPNLKKIIIKQQGRKAKLAKNFKHSHSCCGDQWLCIIIGLFSSAAVSGIGEKNHGNWTKYTSSDQRWDLKGIPREPEISKWSLACFQQRTSSSLWVWLRQTRTLPAWSTFCEVWSAAPHSPISLSLSLSVSSGRSWTVSTMPSILLVTSSVSRFLSGVL